MTCRGMLCALLQISLVLPFIFGAGQCRSNSGRHHLRHGHISRFHNYDTSALESQQSQYHIVRPQDVSHNTRQVHHTYQRGSVRIPYHGASVNVQPTYGSKKMFRGTVTTTILDKKSSHGHHNSHYRKSGTRKHRNRDKDWELSHDEPIRRNETPCAKCPGDRAVIAKRGSITTIMERLPITPCFPWSHVDEVNHEVMLGPQPGQIITEGTHALVTRFTQNNRPIGTCHVMYSVIVRKCELLETEGILKVDCPLGEAWGASCYFSCPEGYQLVGANSTECNDQLEWSDRLPFCAVTTSCTIPVTPENGRLTCRTPQHRPVKSRSILPDGTVCQYRCSTGFQIPESQAQLAAVQCFAGQWNSTQDPTCIENNLQNEAPAELRESDTHLPKRFGRKHCPKGLCRNGGKCYIILGEPLCLCPDGYSGPSCTELIDTNSLT